MFYIGLLYRENMKKIFLSETTRPSWLIFGLWHHLVDLYQVCSNLPLGLKMGPPRGPHILHRLIKGNYGKIFLYEFTRQRALIFDILASCTQWTSTEFVQIIPLGPRPGSGHMFYIYILIKGNHSKIFLSETTKPRALIFGM